MSQLRYILSLIFPIILSFSAVGDANKSILEVWSDGRIEVYEVHELESYKSSLRANTNKKLIGANITWNISYQDVNFSTGVGFDDSFLGAKRRSALEETLLLLDDILNNTSSVVLELIVNESKNTNTSNLASAGTNYITSGAGFYDGLFAQHVQTGSDPDPMLPDMFLNVNFFHSYNIEKRAPSSDEHDFRSIVLHEVLHAVGIASFLAANGQSSSSNTNPGVFTRFDQFIVDGTSTSPLMTGGGLYTGTTARLTGEENGLFWGGTITLARHQALKLYTPTKFSGGSSISHWGGSIASLMKPFIGKGKVSRQISDFEVTALKDIGYVNALSPLSGLLSFASPITFKESGQALAGSVSQLLGRNSLAFIQINTIGTKSYLSIYKDLDPNQKYILELDDHYTRMSPLDVAGPMYLPGVVLSTIGQEKILTLGGLNLPSTSLLSFDDFVHVHHVKKRSLKLQTTSELEDQNVVIGDLDDDGLVDVLTYTPKWGFRRFINDKEYYFDGWYKPKTVESAFASIPVRGISVFDRIGPTAEIFPRVDFTSGISIYNRAINRIDLLSNQESIVFPMNGSLPKGHLSHVQTSAMRGVGVFVDGDKNIIVRFVEIDDKYQIVSRHNIEGSVSDVHLMDDSTVLIANTFNHAIYRMSLADTDAPSIVAGGTAGFVNGNIAMAKFDRPLAICGSDKTAYVIDANNQLIRKIDLKSNNVTTLTGIQGKADIISGPKGVGKLAFQYPRIKAHDCTVSGDSLYFWDYKTNTQTDMMRKVNTNTGYVSFVSSWKANQNNQDITSSNGNIYLLTRTPENKLVLEYRETDQKPVSNSSYFTSYKLSDLDNDGRNEIVGMSNWKNNKFIHVYKRNSNNEYQKHHDIPLNVRPLSFGISRIDNDYYQDLVVSTNGSIKIFLGNKVGGFVEDTRLEVPTSSDVISIQLIDINRDNRTDIVGVNSNNELLVWLSDQTNRYAHGSGNSFESYNLRLPSNSGYHSVLAGRFNHDNYVDVVLKEVYGNQGILLLGKKPSFK